MAWECACGTENRETSKPCSGCGWTIEHSEEYKKQLSQGQPPDIKDIIIDPEIEKSGINNTKRLHFIFYSMLSVCIIAALLVLLLIIMSENNTLPEKLEIVLIYLSLILSVFYVASFLYIHRLTSLLEKRGIKNNSIIIISLIIFPILAYIMIIRDTKSVSWWPTGGFKTFIGCYK